ncbi:hypothetical protein HYV43_04105 [Candidatus Micrarchaeota archaeon]|nr:hypothetical protein [Candidatus Micrarchaeota archaeon]
MSERILKALQLAKKLAHDLKNRPETLPEDANNEFVTANTGTQYHQTRPTEYIQKIEAASTETELNAQAYLLNHPTASSVHWTQTKNNKPRILIFLHVPGGQIVAMAPKIRDALEQKGYRVKKVEKDPSPRYGGLTFHIRRGKKSAGILKFSRVPTIELHTFEAHAKALIRALFRHIQAELPERTTLHE